MSTTAPQAIVFDFDGTLADTFSVAVAIFNQLSTEFGFRPIRDDEIPSARKMSARQVTREFGISNSALPRIAAKGLKLLHSRMDEVAPFEGITDLLHELGKRHITLGILTSNSAENVNLFLARNEIEYFSFIQPSSRLFGKAREIRALLKRHGWSPSQTLFIGDECRDIEAAHRAGVPIVAVTWGFNTPEALVALSPRAIIDRPDGLLSLLDDTHPPA